MSVSTDHVRLVETLVWQIRAACLLTTECILHIRAGVQVVIRGWLDKAFPRALGLRFQCRYPQDWIAFLATAETRSQEGDLVDVTVALRCTASRLPLGTGSQSKKHSSSSDRYFWYLWVVSPSASSETVSDSISDAFSVKLLSSRRGFFCTRCSTTKAVCSCRFSFCNQCQFNQSEAAPMINTAMQLWSNVFR